MFLRALIFLGLCCLSAHGYCDAGSNTFTPEDAQALRHVAEEWQRCWNSHDMDAFAALFADDVDFVTKSGTWFKGKAATMKHHRQNHATIFKYSVWSTDSVDMRYVAPDVAIIHFGWGLSDDTHHDGTYSAPRHGISTWVLAKRRAQWQLIAVHNVNIEKPQ
jgi:uncharacterized protein (TIGR02246 family)